MRISGSRRSHFKSMCNRDGSGQVRNVTGHGSDQIGSEIDPWTTVNDAKELVHSQSDRT